MKLIIVESPNKIKKIQSFVDNTFNVSASCGHIRNMDPKCMSIEIDGKTDTFTPIYIVVSDKKKVVSELSKLVKSIGSDGTVYLAMDFDREGEAIAWHLNEVLKLKKTQTKRITFTEITKKAILTAIDNPTDIDMNMFYSQQARMVLDKLIGYMISPILWKQFSNYKLSAGRVQSVVVKIINERETEIAKFQSTNFFKITSNFWIDKLECDFKTAILSTNLENEIKSKEQLDLFLKYVPIDEKPTDIQKETIFVIESTKTNQTKRKPSPPFITSTLQQEASIKLSMNPKSCMSSAQKLYENGLITYMRTDSTVLSDDAHKSISDTIHSKYGVVYYNKVVYKSKSKTSQEAHEAIRPTHFEKESIIGDNSKLNSYDNKLYQLIWKRTIASQMKPADVEITTLKIHLHNDNLDAKCKDTKYVFVGKFEKILFDGYLKLITPLKSDEDDKETHKTGKVVSDLILKKLKKLKKGDSVYMSELNALEKHSKPPKSRFTEASLIKRLDELEIGRPSTYAAVVSKVQEKLYVENKTVPPIKKNFINIDLKYPNTKSETTKKVSVDGEKNKLFVTPLGYMTNEYLEKQFSNILDYGFTANVETLLDEIAKGNKVWNIVVGEVYKTFNPTVEKIMISLKSTPNSSASSKFETIELGLHPDNDVPIIVINTKYGPAVVLNYEDKKDRIYGNFNGSLTDMTLENAIKLLEYPKTLGSYKDSPIIVNKRQNYYLTYKKKNYSIDNYNKQFENTDSDSDSDIATGSSIHPTKIKCETISLEESIKVIEYLMKYIVDDIQITKDILIKKGPYGFYIKYKTKINVAIIYKYKKQYTTFEKMKQMTLEECNECIEKHSNKSKNSTTSAKPYKKKT
jgi:DNA topoisomerase I